MVDLWRSAANKVNATNIIARAATQKQDERYHRAPRIPPPSDPPPYTPPQQHPQLYGENASYYTPQPASPFLPASNAPGQQYGAFAPAQGWHQAFPNAQEHNSQQRSDVAIYPTSNVMGQPGYSYNTYVTTPPPGSPPMDYALPQPYDNSSSPPQAPFPPPQRSQTEYGYVQSPPPSLPRSYTEPVEPHNCNEHQHP
jgi:tyrosine-protein phosphatase non-receptor type 23